MNTFPRRSGARTRSAATLVVLTLAAGLGACGSDYGGTATDPAGSTSTTSPTDDPTEEPTEEPTETSVPTPTGDPTAIPAVGSAGVTEVSLVFATEGGGSPSTLAFALDTDQAVQDFVAGFQNGLAEKVTATVAEVAGKAPDATPYGAVVATGCEAPRGVAIDAGEAGFEVVPKLPKSTVQCFAPVTYVVVFGAPDA